MKIDYNVENIFSVPIHIIDIDNFSSLQKKLIYLAYKEEKRSQGQGRKASNVGGYQSFPFQLRERNDKLSQVLLGILSNLPCFEESIEIESSAWININKPGDSNQNHNHPATNLAGVLWIKIPENSGNIKFLSPYNFSSYGEINSYTEDFKLLTKYYYDYVFEPKEGSMIIFPAHLIHKVEENKSDEDRISVSFNIDLHGYLD